MMQILRRILIISYENVKRICLGLDVGFIVIHGLLVLLFWHHKVWPMFVFNIFSVILYFFIPVLLYKNRFATFVQLMHLEVAVHMVLATYFVGWESGFHLAVMGFNIFLVWAEYIATSLNLRRIHSLLLCVISMFLYIGIAIADHYHVAPYLMPAASAYKLKVAWAATVFVITIIFLQIFAYLASGMQKKLAEEALHDKLTGLHNRYYMNDYLERILKKDGCWLAIADIDGFKQVNDVYGHNCGDYVLKTLAELLGSCKGEVCRWGGEEFLLVGQNDTLNWLEDFRRQVEEYDFVYEDKLIHLTITIGAAAGRPDESVEDWVNRADMKLYEGKTTGKNKVVIQQ